MTQIDVGQALGILGAYFAVLLVLAIAVETILEPFTYFFAGLRKKISPEDIMKDVNEWVTDTDPQNSKLAETKIAAIKAFAGEYTTAKDTLLEDVSKAVDGVQNSAIAAGLGGEFDRSQQMLATYIAAIRKKYNLDERKRITILRAVSAVIGILLAAFLKINSFELLKDLIVVNAAPWLGIVVTGLSASAGSSFWHDMLGRVRAAKEASQQIQQLTRG